MPTTGVPGGRDVLDNNSYNRLTPPPSPTSVIPNQGAGNSGVPSGYVPSNATNAPASPPSDEVPTYQQSAPMGRPDTNRIVSEANTKVGI